MANRRQKNLLIVTGMSGAGKSVTLNSLEDIGYFCIDNMPPSLMTQLIKTAHKSDELENIAVVMDSRTLDIEGILIAIKELKLTNQYKLQMLFLEANNNELVKRYKETRRAHPLSKTSSPSEGIEVERNVMEPLKDISDYVIDTSYVSANELKKEVKKRFKIEDNTDFKLNIVSFGYKHGTPIDCDVLFDVRFLPNPFYNERLRPLTGLDQEVYDYVHNRKDTKGFLKHFNQLLEFTIPKYENIGKSQLVIGIGCTGGQHRSVSIVEYLGSHFTNQYQTYIWHRDIEKARGYK